MNNLTNNNWYKNAVIYGLDIETFFDADGDGIGDFKGATTKLSYLSWLGINCVWLLPFYPTANRDNGYDVTNYIDVDQRLGTLNDFRLFIKEAKKRGIRVIIDLVLHHSSNQHPWFIAATSDKNSKYYNYYIWTKQLPPKPHDENIFPTEEDSVWKYENNAKAYYHHKFYHFEPDLNIANPDVQNELYTIIDFWISLEVDGFRIDAATHIFEEKGLPGTEIKNPGAFLHQLREHIYKKKQDTILLGEADVNPKKLDIYFGNNDRFQLLFNFLLNNSLFLSLSRRSSAPVISRLMQLQRISPHGNWANFARNLDELDLERLTKKEREEVYRSFAPDPSMRVYNRGIRRRLAPMLHGDIRWIKMTYSLLFSLPGAPLFVYGDEIGMGDDLSLKERIAVRTPMQWNTDKNAGFSSVNKELLIRNIISKGKFSYKKINVECQQNKTDSLLFFFKKLISLRNKYELIGEAQYQIINSQHDSVVALYYQNEKKGLLTLHNLSNKKVTIILDNLKIRQCLQLLSDSEYSDKNNAFQLNKYGYRWFEVDVKKVSVK